MEVANNILERFYRLENFEYSPIDGQSAVVIRTFYPIIKRILSDDLTYNIYQERFGLTDKEISKIKLFVAYYSLNTSYVINKSDKRKPNPLLKNRRKYLESTLYYSKSFNSEYSKSNKQFRNPSKKEVNEKTRDIIANFFTRNKLSDKKVRDAILDNIYLDELKILHSDNAAIEYFLEQLKIAKDLWDKFSLENVSVEEIRNRNESIKTVFSSDNLLDYLRKKDPSLDLLVEKALVILNKYKHPIVETDNSLIVKEVNKLAQDLLILLLGFKKNKKTGLNEKIDFWNNELLKIKSADQKPLESLQWIIDEFAGKDGLKQLLLRISEKYIHIISSTFSKHIFKILDNKTKLTKAEKRLFIIMNIAIPTLGFRLPLLDMVHENFFRFHPDAFNLTMDNIILKKNDTKAVNLFQQFLFFYPIWTMIIKEDEKETKYKSKSISDNDNAITSTITEESKLSDSIEDDELNGSQVEADNFSEATNDNEEMFEIDNQFIIDPDIKIKESSLLQLLKKVLNKKEYLYLINSTLKGLSQSDIAKQYNVSQPYVNKVLSSAIKKSKKDKRIKLFWES